MRIFEWLTLSAAKPIAVPIRWFEATVLLVYIALVRRVAVPPVTADGGRVDIGRADDKFLINERFSKIQPFFQWFSSIWSFSSISSTSWIFIIFLVDSRQSSSTFKNVQFFFSTILVNVNSRLFINFRQFSEILMNLLKIYYPFLSHYKKLTKI